MFKFETAVLILVFGICLHLGSAFAVDTSTSTPGYAQKSELQTVLDQMDCANNKEQCKTLIEAFKTKYLRDNNSCATDVKLLHDIKEKFQDACKEASLSTDCISAFKNCDRDPGTTKSKARDKNAPLDVEGEKARDSKCPAMASGDLKDYEDKLDKAQEHLDKLKDALPKLESDQAQATKDAQKDIADKKKEYAQNQADYSKELSQISKDKDAKDKEIQQQLNSMNAELKKTDDSMRQLEIQKMDAKVKMLDAKTQIELNCHATASSQVGALQAEIIPLLKTKSYNVGSMSTLLKGVGLTDRQSWQRVAYQRYLWCLQSKPTTDSQASANRIYQLALAQANTSKESLVQQEGQLKQQIAQIANSNGCSQAQGALNGETAACQNNRQAKADAVTAQASYDAKQNALNQDIAQAQQSAAQEWQAKNKDIASKNQQVKDEETRLANLQDFLQAKYAAGGHGSSDSKSLSAAFSRFVELKDQANAVVECTKNKSNATDGDPCEKDQDCRQARNLYDNMTGKSSDTRVSTDPFNSSDLISVQPTSSTPTGTDRGPTPDSGASGAN